MDKISKSHRSWNMSRIRSKNTKPELLVRRALFERGVRYRLHAKDLPGKPDIFIRKHKIAIEVKGCFWHGHSKCADGHTPKTNTKFWKIKVETNKNRDQKNEKELAILGYRVFTIWECEAEKKNLLDEFTDEIVSLINTLSK